LVHFEDEADSGEKKFALYRYDHEMELTDELANSTLGKKIATNRPQDLN
jgi:hypothetical protein